MTQAFNIAMVLKADVASAKAALKDVTTGLREVTAEAGRTRSATAQDAAELERLAAAASKAGQQTERLVDAEKRRRSAPPMPASAPEPQPSPANLNRSAPDSFLTANLASQGNDILMMAMAGQNPLQLALQQGTQVSQVLGSLGKGTSITKALASGFMSMVNPVSLATMGIIALGTVGLQALMDLLPETKSLAEALGDLEASAGRYGKTISALRSNDLASQFGADAAAARALLGQIAELDRRTIELNARSAMQAVSSTFDEVWANSILRYRWTPQFAAQFDIGLFDDDGMRKAAAAQAAARRAADATGIDDQITALEELVKLWDAAAEHSAGATAEEDRQAQLIGDTLKTLYQVRALEDNAAGKAAAEEMARNLERQSGLQLTILKYGKDSAQVRAEEAHQQQELTAEKLRGLGIDQNSVTWQKIMAGLQADAAARERGIIQDRARAHDDLMAGLSLERQLIGATTAERLRARAVAEAERTIRDQSLEGAEAELAVTRAIAGAAAEAANERAKAIHDLQTTIRTDALDAQIGMARDPLTKATLEGQREYIRLVGQGADADIAAATAAAARASSLNEAIVQARDQVATISDEVAIRQQVAAQVAAGTMAAGDANAAIQRELQLRPLVAAAARAEGEEKRRLTEIVTGLRLAHELQAAEERRQAQNDYLRGAAERVQQARLELALIGQTATVRARALALVQAERDIRAQGLTGEYAAETRRQALELADLNRQIEAQGDAWASVQAAGESAIDAVLDKLTGGDVKGALAGMLDELNKGFFDLAVRNPLKNILLGTNLGTIDDIGGLRGIRDRLTGRASLDEKAVIGAATAPVQAMQIAAAQVTINAASLGLGSGAARLLAGLPGADASSGVANVNAAPLTDRNGVAAQIWDFFTGKGFAPHQVAAIIGHANAESGFNPLATGDGGAAKGLFQWNSRRPALYDFIGGPGNLGDVQKQLEFAWHELMTSESGVFRKLMAAPDVRSATAAWMTFERPAGYSAANPEGGADWEKRLAGAEQALATFGNTARQAATPVGQMGQTAQATSGQIDQMGAGMEGFGGALQQILGAVVSGNKGGAVGGLISLGVGLLTSGVSGAVAGFSAGGPTGGSDPSRVAGLVHEGEFVFSAPTVQRIGLRNLDALHRGTLKGFARGGYVGVVPGIGDGGGRASGSGNITFAPSFDLRGANDPAEVERAARRGMAAALEDYDRKRLPGRMREIMADRRVV